MQSSTDIRKAAESRWNDLLRSRGGLTSDSLEGSSPPSVFVGSFGYPRLGVGPMAVPGYEDSAFLDAPEKWAGLKLDDLVRYRMNLVRGIRNVRVQETSGRYMESLQEMAMSSHSADAQMIFEKTPTLSLTADGHSAPFGPIGQIKSAKFSTGSSERKIERVYYDTDLPAEEAVLNLYSAGIPVSKIQKCFSVGMMGKKRKLTPTKWSITATDDMISRWLVRQILYEPQIDTCEVYSFVHLGNIFSIVLFPHRWMYEMIEAWHSGRTLGFGSDCEDARSPCRSPAIAGAYHAAKLAVAEHLYSRKLQAGALVLRQITPEYSVPVGVWQVREGVRAAMAGSAAVCDNLQQAVTVACSHTNIPKEEWLLHGNFAKMMLQKTITEYT